MAFYGKPFAQSDGVADCLAIDHPFVEDDVIVVIEGLHPTQGRFPTRGDVLAVFHSRDYSHGSSLEHDDNLGVGSLHPILVSQDEGQVVSLAELVISRVQLFASPSSRACIW